MNPPHPDPPAAGHVPDAPVLPETSPHEPVARPWELELLISGAVVFSLLQLPGYADAWVDRVTPHLGERMLTATLVFFVYVKLILYTLITCFVLHLCMRAYWVGLIGLEAVYPRGIRWEDSSYGPVMTEVYRARMGRLQGRIDAADRFCSILFPLAFTLVMLFFFSVAVTGITAGLAWGLSRLLFGGERLGAVLMMIVVVGTALPLIATLVDRRYGAGMEPGSRGHRMLRRAAAMAYYVNAMPIYGTTFMILFTNARKGARYPAMIVLMALLFAAVMVRDLFMAQGMMLVGNHRYLPDEAGAFGADPGVYEDQREAGEVYPRLPSIQSDVVRGPYVRLFIPYSPVRHGVAMAEQCPGVAPLSPGGLRMGTADPPDSAAVRGVLDCWARLQPVTLNGRPIRPAFRFHTYPGTGVRGIVAYIPVAGLPRGENMLTVGFAPRSRARQRKPAPGRPADPQHYYIPFWL